MTKGYWIPQVEPGEPAKPTVPIEQIEPIEPAAPKPTIKGRKLIRLHTFPDGTQHREKIPAEPPKLKPGATEVEAFCHYYNRTYWTETQWGYVKELQARAATGQKTAKKGLENKVWAFHDAIEPSLKQNNKVSAKILSQIPDLRREVESRLRNAPSKSPALQCRIEQYLERILRKGHS
jgi:hypothetical protein